MRCYQVRKHLEALAAGETSASLQQTLKGHFQDCPACEGEYLELERVLGLLHQTKAITPPGEFGQLWRQRLRREALLRGNIRKDWGSFFQLKIWVPVVGTAVLLVVCLVLINAGIPFGSDRNQTQLSANSKIAQPLLTKTNVVVANDNGGTYQLRIIQMGSQVKLVQQLIRNFTNAHEGGVSFSLRDSAAEMNLFTGLSAAELAEFQKELEHAGAVVEVQPEKTVEP